MRANRTAFSIDPLLIDHQDENGRTPLMNAILNGDMFTAKLMCVSLVKPDFSIEDNDGKTAWQHLLAAEAINFEFAGIMFRAGADSSRQNDKGETILHRICLEVKEESEFIANLSRFIFGMQDFNCKDKQNRTILSLLLDRIPTVMDRRSIFVLLLGIVDQLADPNEKDAQGNTLLDALFDNTDICVDRDIAEMITYAEPLLRDKLGRTLREVRDAELNVNADKKGVRFNPEISIRAYRSSVFKDSKARPHFFPERTSPKAEPRKLKR